MVELFKQLVARSLPFVWFAGFAPKGDIVHPLDMLQAHAVHPAFVRLRCPASDAHVMQSAIRRSRGVALAVFGALWCKASALSYPLFAMFAEGPR